MDSSMYDPPLPPPVGTIFQSYYGGIAAARGVNEIYFMGIIDILQVRCWYFNCFCTELSFKYVEVCVRSMWIHNIHFYFSFQLYNFSKRTETFYKGLFEDKRQLSSVPPKEYAARHVDFILRHTDYFEIHAKREAEAAAEAAAAKSTTTIPAPFSMFTNSAV